ncbi:MAG: hypothetical protein AB7H88_17000 [Vicinamibacterales bacterium]
MRPLVAGLAVVLVAAMAPAGVRAQDDTHNVTVMKRNGDRVTGTFEDMANGQVYIRVSLNDQRKIPVGDVAVIDVTGNATGLPETELSVARGAQHLIVFRDGNSARGTTIDIRGGTGSAEPGEQRLVYLREGNEEKRYPMDDITRLYFGNYPAATAAAAPAAADPQPVPEGAIRVPATSDWVATNVTVRKGDRVSFSATGQVRLSAEEDDIAQPAGSLKQRYAPASPLPRVLAGALIGLVGRTAPFGIGNQGSITMPADGQLYLRVNDDSMGDNSGEYIVTVTPARRR